MSLPVTDPAPRAAMARVPEVAGRAIRGAVFAVLSVCIAATFNRTGRDRTILGSCTAVLALVAMGAAFMMVSNDAAGHVFTVSFVLGFIAFQLVANALATRSRS